MTEATLPQTNMEKIKAGIWDIHEGVTATQEKPAENAESIMKGTLPKFKYIENVKQRYIIQREFEKVLAAEREKFPAIVGHVVTDEQFHAHKCAKDLEFFGVDPASVEALPQTKKMIDLFQECAAKNPKLILAIHYVIEGSNNGGVFIAKAVKGAFGFEDDNGVYHLRPYGNDIRKHWAAFSEKFNELEISDDEMKEMVIAGRQAFHLMNKVADEAHAAAKE